MVKDEEDLDNLIHQRIIIIFPLGNSDVIHQFKVLPSRNQQRSTNSIYLAFLSNFVVVVMILLVNMTHSLMVELKENINTLALLISLVLLNG